MNRFFLSLVLGLWLVLGQAAIAKAELFISGYGGISLNRDEDIRETSSTRNVTFQEVDLQTGPLFGGKVGYWVGRFFGLQLDVYNFTSDVPAQNVSATGTISGLPVTQATTTQMNVRTTAITFGLLGRFPIVIPTRFQNERFERRFEPYLGVGGGVFMSSAEITGGNFDATDTVGGGQAVAGLSAFLTRHVSVFAEYKFTLTDDIRFVDSGVTDAFEIQSQHIGFGINVYLR